METHAEIMEKVRSWFSTAIIKLRDPKSPWQTLALVTFAALAYAYRAKPYLRLPQLFAEDGVLWLAEGFNKSFFAIFEQVNGFLHVPERLFGFVVARLPLQWAPLIFVLTAWGLFILLAYYLISTRTKIFKTNFERIFIIGCLALIGNIHELFFNYSNSVFLMGVIGALILIADTHKNKVIMVLERIFFLLTCFTLPFAWFYLPIVLVEWFKYKRKSWFFLVASAAGSIAQLIAYISSGVDRSPVTVMSLFSKYIVLEIYNQLLVPAIRFTRIDIPILDYNTIPYIQLFVYISVITLAVATIYVALKSKKQVWYLLFFLAAMTFASLKSPTVNVEFAVDAIKHMAIVEGASRYFIYGIVGVSVVIVRTAYLILVPRVRYVCMLIFLAFGLATSLQYQTFFVNKQFTDFTLLYRTRIEQFESGQIDWVNIPVNPAPWNMTLHR